MTIGQSIVVSTDYANSFYLSDDTPSNIDGQYMHCGDTSRGMSGYNIPTGNSDFVLQLYYGGTPIQCNVNSPVFLNDSANHGNHTFSVVPMQLRLVKVADTGNASPIQYPSFQMCMRGDAPDPTGTCWHGHNGMLPRYNPTTYSASIMVEEPIQCGNGLLQAGEECDDGNTISGDGCSATCAGEVIAAPVCQEITSTDLGIPADTTGYDTTSPVDVSSKFNLPAGSVLVDAIGANTVTGGFKVSASNHITFNISGTQSVHIKAMHGGALGADLKDKIFIRDGATYTLTSALATGLSSGLNVNPGYYVKNNTASKIFNGTPFTWMSDTTESYIDFGTTSTVLDSAIKLELCAPAPAAEVCGNGIVEGAEACDDGNTVSGDGCSATCTVESASAECGNGIIETKVTETCTDTAFDELSPTALGITEGTNLSANNVDVSSFYGLPSGSILVSYSSVDVRLKNG